MHGGSGAGESDGDGNRRTFALGIVGAGFGGLSLANLLQERQRGVPRGCGGGTGTSRPRATAGCSFRIFDSRPDGSCSFRGPVRLPSLRRLLQEVPALAEAISSEIKTSRDGGVEDEGGGAMQMVSRARVLEGLSRGVAVRYGCKIVKIVQRESGDGPENVNNVNDNAEYPRYDLVDDEGNRYGPFDAVVAADGALSRFRGRAGSSSGGGAVWCVGDARWVRDTSWLDFGYSRIQRGADIAIRDAILLADAISSIMQNDDGSPLYSASTKRKLLYFQPFYHRTRWAYFLLTSLIIPLLLLFMVPLLCRKQILLRNDEIIKLLSW